MKRKIIDENGKFFGLVSLLDIGAVLLAAALAFAVYTRFFTVETTSVTVGSAPFTYELRIQNVRDINEDSLLPGDVLYSTENNVVLGSVTQVEMVESVAAGLRADGVYVTAPAEDRYDLIVQVEAEGIVSGGRYFASRTFEISPNESIDFYTKYYTSSGTVWSVSG